MHIQARNDNHVTLLTQVQLSVSLVRYLQKRASSPANPLLSVLPTSQTPKVSFCCTPSCLF